MRKDQGIGKTLCLNFCAYYKPGRNEELACRGYRVIERLTKQGRRIPLERKEQERDAMTDDAVIRRLCVACDFRKDGCDFAMDRKAQPCGGFLLLGQLLRAGIITPDDME
ncbi:MAG TPA: hypothetical protein VL197_17075 [Nitrospirota bacterium]|nr:hypothetical protein [Nitrospirota bacterium]